MANFDVLAARKLGREQKKERGGRGRGEKETLADKPLEFEKPVRQRTGLVIGSALVVIIDNVPIKDLILPELNMAVEMEDEFEACLDKALNILSEQGFTCDLRQEQKCSVKQLFSRGDLLAVLPTAFGKSLIFQVLALMKEDCVILDLIFRDPRVLHHCGTIL